MSYKTQKELLDAIVRHCQGYHNYQNTELIKRYNQHQSTGNDWDLILALAKCVKGHVHQARMSWADVVKVVIRILEAGHLIYKTYKDFEELYGDVKALVKGINFAQGKLTTYDIALNIGQLLQNVVEPDKFVYLADCTKGVFGLIYGKHNKPKGHCVERCTIAKDFGNKSSVAIENMLCNFRPLFEKVHNGGIVSDQEIIDLRSKRMRSRSIDWKFVDSKLQPYKAELLDAARQFQTGHP